uniref:Uncharacterized protein n=1 Tax=Ananas comosus var. bracteatus TaxID=296719 RepID=A0A6V7QHI9_ANACO|nr:unnamed protein product [Ananas comosus var. bracteatus]
MMGAVVVDDGPGFDRSDIRLCRGHVTSEIRLHTRLGRAHECRSGVWLCAFTLMSLISGMGAFTVPSEIGSELTVATISFQLYLLALFPSVDLVGGPMMLRAVPTEDYLFL